MFPSHFPTMPESTAGEYEVQLLYRLIEFCQDSPPISILTPSQITWGWGRELGVILSELWSYFLAANLKLFEFNTCPSSRHTQHAAYQTGAMHTRLSNRTVRPCLWSFTKHPSFLQMNNEANCSISRRNAGSTGEGNVFLFWLEFDYLMKIQLCIL